jgi:hypothetical protein
MSDEVRPHLASPIGTGEGENGTGQIGTGQIPNDAKPAPNLASPIGMEEAQDEDGIGRDATRVTRWDRLKRPYLSRVNVL